MTAQQRMVYFEIDSGRAVILLETGEMYLLSVKPDGSIVEPCRPTEGFNINAWINLANSQLVEIDIGAFPFEPLCRHLILKRSIHELETWFKRILNPHLPPLFRRRAAGLFDGYYTRAIDEARTEFRRLMLETPMSNEMDPLNAPLNEGGQGKKLLNEMLARWRA